MPDDVTLARLDDQIAWYSRKSRANQWSYKALKAITIISAAVIPAMTTSPIPHGSQIAAALGVLIAIVEGVQQMSQYHSNWAIYRSSAEALKREKFLYLALAGPYSGIQNPHTLLAQRIEAQIADQDSRWILDQNRNLAAPVSPAGPSS